MLLVNTVNKVPGRKAVSEHPRMPKLFHHAVLAQEENYCSQDQSVNFQQASGNCAHMVQSGLWPELIWLLVMSLLVRNGEICALHICYQGYTNADVSTELSTSLQGCLLAAMQIQTWALFFLASKLWECGFKPTQKTESQRLFGDSLDGTFRREL